MRLTANQLRILRRLKTRELWVGASVSIRTARSLVKHGLISHFAIGEHGEYAPGWGIRLSDAGRAFVETQ